MQMPNYQLKTVQLQSKAILSSGGVMPPVAPLLGMKIKANE